MAWTTPHKWVMGDPITAERMNAISDNLNYLYNTPVSMTPPSGSTHAMTTSWAVVDGMSVTHEVSQGRSLMIGVRIPYITCLTFGNYAYMDIRINKKTYLSSLSTTPTTYGSFVHYFATNSEEASVRFNGIWVSPHEGLYTFEYVVKATTGVTMYVLGGQLYVVEI